MFYLAHKLGEIKMFAKYVVYCTKIIAKANGSFQYMPKPEDSLRAFHVQWSNEKHHIKQSKIQWKSLDNFL